MAKALETLPSGLKIGFCFLGMHGNKRGSIAQQVHDGDTIILEAAGNLSARFLGIDTPEVSLSLPGSNKFLSIGGKDWDEFLADPFNSVPPAFIAALGNDLHQHLQAVTGPGCSSNHAYHANNAHRHLEELYTATNELAHAIPVNPHQCYVYNLKMRNYL